MLTFKNKKELFAYIKELNRQEREIEKMKIAKAQEIKEKMTVEEKIAFLNEDYKKLPKALQPGMSKKPQVFNCVHINKPHLGGQHESFGARLTRFMDKYDIDRDTLKNICNEWAKKYDKEARYGSGRKIQKTRITSKDLTNYLDFNKAPKHDKMRVFEKALGTTFEYLAGYGEQDVSSKNQILEARFRKGRSKNYTKYINGRPQEGAA